MTATQVSSLTASPADPLKTDPIKGNKRNLQWTGAMEKAALKLYAEAVLAGQKSDGGFKAKVHQEVATKLNEQFPGSDFTVKRCKSKLSQVSIDFVIFGVCDTTLMYVRMKSFKKEYNAFVATKAASGFGWDEVRSEVTASKEVWDSFLVVSLFFINECTWVTQL
jgi:hypothetical protein